MTKSSFAGCINAASRVLEAHDAFVSPANFRSKEYEAALLKAKGAYRGAFIKMTTHKADAKREIAIGALTADDISQLYKLARKIAWPLLGLGTVAGIINELQIEQPTGASIAEIEDVAKAVNVLDRPCSAMNALCRDGLEHILSNLQMGKYSKSSLFTRLFSRKSSTVSMDGEAARAIGTDAFLTRFDSGLAAFKDQRTNDLEQFYDENHVTPRRGLFLVLFVEFLIYATAQEIRALILFTDGLRTNGALSRKQFILPRMKLLRKRIGKLFSRHQTEDIVGEEYPIDEGTVFTEAFTGRVNRIFIEFKLLTVETAAQPTVSSPILQAVFKSLAAVGNFFASPYSQFGLRAAYATVAGTLPAFFSGSYAFFIQYRGVWITITVVIAMSPTTGASIYGLFKRLLGTIVGGVLAMVVWYIVDGHIPGVIVFSLVVGTFRNGLCLNNPINSRLLFPHARFPSGLRNPLLLLIIDSPHSQFYYHFPLDSCLWSRGSHCFLTILIAGCENRQRHHPIHRSRVLAGIQARSLSNPGYLPRRRSCVHLYYFPVSSDLTKYSPPRCCTTIPSSFPHVWSNANKAGISCAL